MILVLLMRLTMIIAAIFCLQGLSLAQMRTVHGRLMVFNAYPVRNLEATARKAGTTVRTDSAGWFSIECQRKDVIHVRSDVFRDVSFRISGSTDTLMHNLVFLDEGENRDIAVGLGYIRGEDLAFAVNYLDHQNNDFCNYENVFELLEGRFPGVRVEYHGSRGAIYIRGSRSAGSSAAALTVVDGIIQGGIGWIHPCDIKSVNIIKDGMTALYGANGANGVVVIETRFGEGN